MPQKLTLNSASTESTTSTVVPQIRDTSGKLTADTTKTYLLSRPRHAFQCPIRAEFTLDSIRQRIDTLRRASLICRTRDCGALRD